jgi:hypothetical protein
MGVRRPAIFATIGHPEIVRLLLSQNQFRTVPERRKQATHEPVLQKSTKGCARKSVIQKRKDSGGESGIRT